MISNLYRHYQPLLSKVGFTLNLDVPNPSDDSKNLQVFEKYLDFVLEEGHNNHFHQPGTITITERHGRLILTDDATLLTPEKQQHFKTLATTSHVHLSLRSRLGFGTRLTLS